jgi:signal transduction histidine kinase/ligand-binding sensor domain-containing protein
MISMNATLRTFEMINQQLRILALVVLIFLTGSHQVGLAQLNPDNLTHYTEMDGNNIFDLLPDQFGNIWMTSHNGLIRFDGYEFTRFYSDPNDSTSISNILVSSLFEDSKGRIWVGGAWVINLYDPNTNIFRSFPFYHLTGVTESSQPWIDTITEDLTGRMYFGASDFHGLNLPNSLFYFDEQTQTIQVVESPGFENISNISQSTTDPSGNSWFIGRSGITRISPDGALQAIALPEGTDTSDHLADRFTIASDVDGLIWITFATSTIHIYNPDTRHYELLGLPDIPGLNTRNLMINKIHFDEMNTAWLATSAGIIQYIRESGEWLTFSNDGNNRISDLDIIAFDTDSFGNVWMGTWQAGLLKYENQRIFNSYRGDIQTPQKISNGWVKRIIESDDGFIWLSTVGATSSLGGINKIDFGDESITSINYDKLRAGWFFSVEFTEVSPGIFYTSNETGLFSLDVSTMELTDVDTQGLQDGSLIEKYYRDHNGTEWLGTYNGLYERKTGRAEYLRHDLSSLPGGYPESNEVMFFVPDSTSGLWLLTNYGLFYYRYDTERIERHAHDPAQGDILASQDVNSLYRDDNGIVWVGTWAGGLSRYDTITGQIKTYTMSDGLPSMSVQYILKDEEKNDLWLSTFNGISRFDIDTGQFVNYTMENGLHSQLFTDGSGLKTSDGLFIFGGSNGITFFRPSEVSNSSPPPSMFFTDLKIDDVSHPFVNGIYNADQIELAHHQNTISIDYTGIHYSNPARNRFSYILENYDTGWRDVGLQRTAYYPNLPPGNYVFRVKAANSNGVWNEEGISMNIVISPPWWKTIWAYLIYGFLFTGAVYGIDRSQRRRLVRQQQERAREKELAQAKEIEKAYNELGKAHQNLETAHFNLKAAQNQLVQQEKLASLGQLTAGIAHEIKNPLNFVNNFSEVSLEMIDEALEELLQIGENEHATETAAILADIKSNLTKIHDHGSRADGIVKSMLMHSRGSTGTMEPTDLNALIKEYVNLSYHGMRAGADPIEVDIDLLLDESIGEVPLIAEDFSRVILNLCSNAFDACAQGPSASLPQSPGGSFESLPQSGSPRRVPPASAPTTTPRLTIRTKKTNATITIDIEDNGPGIPDDIKEKILQPFFTTKKGTQGTGLGLSITNDIIKAHGGELIIKSGTFGTVMTIKLHLPN